MRVFRRVAVAALVLLVAACGKDANDPIDTVAGTYTLRSVNGQSLPAVVYDDGSYKLEVTAASYVLAASGSFTNSISIRETENGVVTPSTEVDTGTYAVNGTTITLTDAEGDVISGTLSGDTLTFSSDGITAVSRK